MLLMQRKTRARAKHTANLAFDGSSGEELRGLQLSRRAGLPQKLDAPKGSQNGDTLLVERQCGVSPPHFAWLTVWPEEQMVAMGWPDPCPVCVFPWLNPGMVHSSCSTSEILSGFDKTQMSSRKAINVSVGCRAGINGSPCSPPSPCWISWTVWSSSSHKCVEGVSVKLEEKWDELFP